MSYTAWALRPLLLILCLTLTCLAAEADDRAADDDFNKPIVGWEADLDRIAKAIARESITGDELADISDELRELRSEAGTYIDELGPKLRDAKSQLARLGPPPDEKEGTTESEEVAALRKELGELVADIDGAIKQARLIVVRSEQLERDIQNIRRARFSADLFERSKNPLSLEAWRKVIDGIGVAANSFALLIEEWWHGQQRPLFLVAIVSFGIAIWAAMAMGSRAIIARLRHQEGPEPPTFLERTSSAAWVTLARAAPPLAFAGFVYLGMKFLNNVAPRFEELVTAALLSLAAVFAVWALTSTLLAPNRPAWRIFPTSDATAKRAYVLVTLIAAVYGIDLFLNELDDILFAPLAVTSAQSFITSLVFAGLGAALMHTERTGAMVAADGTSSRWPRFIRWPIWLSIIAIVAAALTGYIALARFIASQVVVTGSILALAYLFYIADGELIKGIARGENPIGRWLAKDMKLTAARRETVAVVTGLLANLLLILVVAPLILIQWGVHWEEIESWFRAALFGFEIGHVRISLATILIAILLFAFGLFATRWLQGWLDNRVLAKGNLGRGMRDSVRTMLGYVGFILAAILAVSYLGIDFSNLAIVAGALSVGIGFGLQSIVNNFVSGLILLAERPIKVGDWIVVGEDEGIVRKINVRSTEIETFNRSSVVIPNSDLISGKVINWTLHNNVGRVIIPIGVSYDSDPEQVRNILLQVARDHPSVLDDPAPLCFFEDFGASSLDFTLRAYVDEINRGLTIRTELRIGIVKAFREAGIEIPFPQRDLNLRDLDRLERAIATRSKPAARAPARRRKSSEAPSADE